eukprot:CAMPEP_0168354942 /NCGR_PEP_ID=MMETSP0213-20121227/24218_1 /TAXON_ID=151035 /ORGANISM="Euplotes harpa, Strain FSP1.4" /LENGTH=44 /DNA_ID= /DNA_START= /DNA_END= /DNA_ORIENTATION=
MASILEFSLEEKQLLGLMDQPTSEPVKQNFGAKLLDFLLEEDEE